MTAEVTVAYAEKLEGAVNDIRELCTAAEHRMQCCRFMPPLVSIDAVRRILRSHNI